MKYSIFTLAVVLLTVGSGCVPVPNNGPVAPTSETTSSSTKLDLSNQNLTQVPKSVFSQTNLTELDLSNNQLSGAIPGEIRFLSRLEVLDLSDNAMTGLPAEIGQLSALKTLDLSNNQLTGLPLELGNLSALSTLDLRGNDYSSYDLNLILEQLPSTVNVLTDSALLDWQEIDAGRFTISLPLDWEFNKLQGIDSYVAEFVGDGATLTFDYGWYSSFLADEGDPNYIITYETIDSYRAKIVLPKVTGSGITGVYFEDLGGDPKDTFQLSGNNLTAEQQETALRIFRTINFR